MKNSKILRPILVLTSIALVCATILTLVNHFWSLSDDQRFAMAVNSIIKADSFRVVYNFDDPSDEHKQSDEYRAISDFNAEYGAGLARVDKVRIAVGGEHDGCYLITSTGRGYKGAYVQMLTGYDKNGAILGIKLMDFDTINNRMGLIDWNTAASKVKGKTDSVGAGKDIVASTGATLTLDGAAEAINLATEFHKKVILGQEEKAEIVTNPTKIADLDKLFSGNSAFADIEISEYKSYPIRTTEATVSGGKASVIGAYTADDTYLILEVKGSYVTYGGWTLLVLVDKTNNSVAALNPTAAGLDPDYDDKGNYVDASPLYSADTLTNLFKGKVKEDLAGLPDYLQGTTHATETNRGLKLTVYHALDNIDLALGKIADFDAQEVQ